MYVHMYIYRCIYRHMYMQLCTYMYVYTHIYIYYIHSNGREGRGVPRYTTPTSTRTIEYCPREYSNIQVNPDDFCSQHYTVPLNSRWTTGFRPVKPKSRSSESPNTEQICAPTLTKSGLTDHSPVRRNSCGSPPGQRRLFDATDASWLLHRTPYTHQQHFSRRRASLSPENHTARPLLFENIQEGFHFSMATVKWRTMGNNKRSRPRRPLLLTRAVRFDDEEEDGGAHQAWF